MSNKFVKFKKKNGIGLITLSRPDKLNSFNPELISELEKIIDRLDTDPVIRVVVITGAGKAFSTGGDIFWEMKIGNMPTEKTKEAINYVKKVFGKIEKMQKPVIAAINGYAVGGGIELAMACDIRVASKSAKFVHPETYLGLVAPLGGTQRLPRLIGLGRAKYMLFTGNEIDAEKALAWGLVDEVVEDEKLIEYVFQIANRIKKNCPLALKLTKIAVNKNYNQDFADEFETDCYALCSKSAENKKRLRAFLRKKRLRKIIKKGLLIFKKPFNLFLQIIEKSLFGFLS